jgi:hypothetical protein
MVIILIVLGFFCPKITTGIFNYAQHDPKKETQRVGKAV